MAYREIELVSSPTVDRLLGPGRPYSPALFEFCGRCDRCLELTGRLRMTPERAAEVLSQGQLVFELLRELEADMNARAS